uniref:RING zinc finger protein n=1 Tax=Solanum tuberosum TaxID=4113 RepID=M1C5R8_SOLTU
MTSSAVNLVMTVIGFTVSIIFIVFVCTRLICARIQYLTRRRSSAYTSRSDLSILERGLHGLEPLAVANFPTKKYSDAFFSFAEDTHSYSVEPLGVVATELWYFPRLLSFHSELLLVKSCQGCTICLAEYREEDTLRILPLCGHYFHATCIDIWFQQHSTCPVCRISLRETADKKCFLQPLFSSAVRSQYTMDTLNVNSNQCSSSGQRLSSRSHDNQRTNPTTASASNA